MRWLAAMLLVLFSVNAQEVSVPPSKWDSHLLDLDEQAIDAAYRQQLQLLYSNWMKDYAQPSSKQRVRTGARNSREAYIQAMDRIEMGRKR